jgi:uncharacterized protein (TIGR02996 family)
VTTKLDELIAQCRAAPDDDAPRLAWATEMGGERGELVEVQCRLASGGVTNRDDWRRLRARERALLAANGRAWSGLGDEYPSRCIFRRGFIDALGIVCSYDSRLDPILAMLPLARSISNNLVVQDDYDFAKLVANPRCSDFAALDFSTDRVIEHLVDRGVVLRAVSISQCSREGARLLAESGLLTRVERLGLGSVEDPAQILAATPRLRALHIGTLDPYAASIPPTVVELGCSVRGGIEAVAALAIAPTLERLRVEVKELIWDCETLAVFRSLRSLDLGDSRPGPRYQPFIMERPGLMPALRELSLGLWFDEQSIEPIARALGPQLDTLHWDGRLPRDLSIQDRMRAMSAPLAAGNAAIGTHVDGEFVVGMMPPWSGRPLEFGDDIHRPWFEGGVPPLR